MTPASHISRGRRWLSRLVLGIGMLAASLAAASAATPVQKVTSPGGVEAWLIESHESGLISMRFSFEGGALAEPKDRPGIATLAAYLFNEGAGDMNTEQLSRARQRIGVDFAGWSDSTGDGVVFTTPSAYRAEAFGLLRKAMEQPRFDADAVARALRQYEAELMAELQNPGSIAGTRFGKLAFGETRLGMAKVGTLETLKTLTAADAETYRRRIFARNTLKVAVAGDITAADLAPVLDELFGALPAHAETQPYPIVPAKALATEVVQMNVPQTIVMAGNIGPRLTWRQQLAFSIGNQVLSGGTTGHLFQEVREKRGLVYTIQAYRYDVAATGVFMLAFGAGAENVQPALQATRQEIDRFLREGPTADEFAAAKEAFLGSFFLGLDTNDKLVNQVMWMVRNDLPITYLDDYAAELEKITLDDVMATVRLAIRPEGMMTVVVGNLPENAGIAATPVVKTAN